MNFNIFSVILFLLLGSFGCENSDHSTATNSRQGGTRQGGTRQVQQAPTSSPESLSQKESDRLKKGPLSDHGAFSVDISWQGALVTEPGINSITVSFYDNGLPLEVVNLISVKTNYILASNIFGDRDEMSFSRDVLLPHRWIVSGIKFPLEGNRGDWQFIITGEINSISDVARVVIEEDIRFFP